MIRATLMSASLLFCGLPMAVAEPIDDARVIVDATLNDGYFEASLGQIGDLMSGFMQNEFRKNGTELSNDASEVVTGMMMDSMIDGMASGMREPMAQAYVANFTPETLAAYRAFFETPAGQEISAGQGLIISESGKVGEQIGQTLGGEAVVDIKSKIETNDWPTGTLESTKNELRKAFE